MKKKHKVTIAYVTAIAALIAALAALFQAFRPEQMPPRAEASAVSAPATGTIDVTPTLESSFQGRWHGTLSGKDFELVPIDESNFIVYEVVQGERKTLGYGTVHGEAIELSLNVEKKRGSAVALHDARVVLRLDEGRNRLVGTFYGDTSEERGPIEWRRVGA